MPDQPPIDAQRVFEILVRENADMLMTYLRAVVWKADTVDDLFQETMLTAWRRLGDYDTQRPFGPWLRGIAARLVMAHRRKAQRDAMLCDENVLAYLDRQIDHIARRSSDTWDEKIAALRDCIQQLPKGYREAIDQRYGKDQPVRMLARSLNLSMEAVKKRLQRARQRLADCLKEKHVLLEPES